MGLRVNRKGWIKLPLNLKIITAVIVTGRGRTTVAKNSSILTVTTAIIVTERGGTILATI